MTKISTPMFFIVSILSFFGGFIYSRLRSDNKEKTENNEPKHKLENFTMRDDKRTVVVHNHTTWFGDTMYVENDTTFIKRK